MDLTNVLTPRVFREFQARLKADFGFGFRWSHALGSTGPTPCRDVYEMYPLADADGNLTELHEAKAHVLLRDLFSDYSGWVPHEVSVSLVRKSKSVPDWHRGRNPRTGGPHAFHKTDYYVARLVTRTPFGPPAADGIVNEINHRREMYPNWTGEDQADGRVTLSRQVFRWKPGERCLTPSRWKGDPPVYYVSSFYQPAGQTAYLVLRQTAYLVLRQVTERVYDRTANDDRVCFLWDTGPGVGDYSTTVDLTTINQNSTEPYYRREYYKLSRVNKIEKFFPEEER